METRAKTDISSSSWYKNVKMQISCAVTHPDMTFMGIWYQENEHGSMKYALIFYFFW